MHRHAALSSVRGPARRPHDVLVLDGEPQIRQCHAHDRYHSAEIVRRLLGHRSFPVVLRCISNAEQSRLQMLIAIFSPNLIRS